VRQAYGVSGFYVPTVRRRERDFREGMNVGFVFDKKGANVHEEGGSYLKDSRGG
jgi:hypothetical protein